MADKLELIGFALRRRWILTDFYCLRCVSTTASLARYGRPAYAVVRGSDGIARHVGQQGAHLPDRPLGAVIDADVIGAPELVRAIGTISTLTNLRLARSLAVPFGQAKCCKVCGEASGTVPGANDLMQFYDLTRPLDR